jgi:predicted nuclease of predicted toxin-antitoxin system
MTAGPERLLLDEMLPPQLATELSNRGIDTRAVTAEPALIGSSDDDLVELALAEQRTIVTMDVGDFHRIRINRTASGLPMPPLIFVSAARFATSRDATSRLVTALGAAVAPDRTAASGGVRWLAAPR